MLITQPSVPRVFFPQLIFPRLKPYSHLTKPTVPSLPLVSLSLSPLPEIGRVRKDMYIDTMSAGPSDGRDSEELPDGIGPVAQLQEKLYVPVKEYPDVSGQTQRSLLRPSGALSPIRSAQVTFVDSGQGGRHFIREHSLSVLQATVNNTTKAKVKVNSTFD